MTQSKYPQQLDSSAEIPAVRDNITEISGEIINSLRSAIFKIEQTLGINPQGSSGQTVAERLNRSLDSSGNLKSDALERTNLLTGPILDNDVSTVAAIKESKLKLDFPTTLLQDEISILNAEINEILTQLSEIATTLSVHITSTALNQHSALSISVTEAESISSDVGTLNLSENNLQDTLEEIYNSHINYSGANISSLNNSHKASQIYFDTENVSDTIFSSSVQGAIEDLANVEAVGFRNAILNIASNGRIRKGSVIDSFENNNSGTILIPESSATYIQEDGASKTTWTLLTPRTSVEDISEFDILTLTGAELDSDNISYQVAEVILNGNDEVQDIITYGGPKGNSTSGLFIEVTKNPYVTYNSAGFSCVARPRSTKTNTPDVQVLNPDSAIIISQGITPENLTETNNAFNLSIDDGESINISTYNSSFSNQTIDTIVQKINDQFVDNHLNATAFKVKIGNCYELAISHNVPNISSDIIHRTLEISPGSSNNGIEDLGFVYIQDQKIRGTSGHSLHLNGLILSQFGLVQSFTSDLIAIETGTLEISLYSNTFLELGIRIGDLVVITNSSETSDDGTYRIREINGQTATLDLNDVVFSGSLNEDSIIHIIRATANVGEFDFEEISSTDGTILFDVFMSEDKNIFQSKRLEIDGSLRSGNFYAVISDISKNYITKNETATLTVNTNGYATLTNSNSETGNSVYVAYTGTYKIFDPDGLSFVTLDVKASEPPTISKTITLYGFNEIKTNNYHLSRGGFATSLGRILGASTNPGIPILIDKRNSGTADHSIIGESFIEKYIEGPRNELRSSGVIKGCQVLETTYTDTGSDIYQTFSVSAGIIIVNGIRYEFSGVSDFKIDGGNDYIVIINEKGCVQAGNLIDNPQSPGNNISPFFESNVAYLAEVTDNGDQISDLRLFLDHLDYKIIGDIKVSNDPKHGHFTSLSDAVTYSKKFNKMFPLMSPPSILLENGEYEIDETIIINFDVTISGSGPNTIITKSASFGTGEPLTGDDVDFSTAAFLIGQDSNTPSDNIIYGITLKNFTYYVNDANLTNVGCAIVISQPLSKLGTNYSREAQFTIENVIFNGPSTIDGSVSDPNKIGEFALIVGQQNPNTLAPTSGIIMGNILFKNCRLHRMGLEVGAIKFTESASSTFQDIIISNNIITKASPNLSSTDSILLEFPSTPTLNNIVEVGNVFRVNN